MGAHLIEGEFQSDKYPTTPRGKVPLSVRDPMAQDLLWEYAQRRRRVDGEFSDDLESALRSAEYAPRESDGALGDLARAEFVESRLRQFDGRLGMLSAEEEREYVRLRGELAGLDVPDARVYDLSRGGRVQRGDEERLAREVWRQRSDVAKEGAGVRRTTLFAILVSAVILAALGAAYAWSRDPILRRAALIVGAATAFGAWAASWIRRGR